MSAPLKNVIYFGVGLAALMAVSAKHRLSGYQKPTPYPRSDWEHAWRNAEDIVDDYRKHAIAAGRRFEFRGARVLELGPGMTLGTGVLLAGLGIAHYHAIDAFPLAQSVSADFYRGLAERPYARALDREQVARAADVLADGGAEPISYAVDPAFNVETLVGGRTFDLIVSNAAFEHVEAVDATIEALSACAAPGALFMAMVDFQTHSRLVRDRDPNSIYRFPEPLYRALRFPGQPNRRRPRDYVRALQANGWMAPEVRAVDTASPQYAAWSSAALSRPFRDADSEMHILTGVIVAQRPQAKRIS